jgi:hypothetical protein
MRFGVGREEKSRLKSLAREDVASGEEWVVSVEKRRIASKVARTEEVASDEERGVSGD